MTYRAIIFDLDGTLLDTLEDLADSANYILAKNGFPIHDLDAYRYFVGDGVAALVQRILPAQGRDDPAVVQRVREGFLDRYALHSDEKTVMYDGIAELLDELTRRAVPMAILSNKPDRGTQRCVELFLNRWDFDFVFGQRDDVPRKPDPTAALHIASKWGLSSEEIFYLGDTATDMQTGRSAGMFTVGATWGFRPEEELRAARASAIVHHPREVVPYFDKVDS